MRVLVVNAGSSSLKLSVLDAGNQPLLERDEPLPDGADPAGPLGRFLADAPAVSVAGHRVVHGGPRFREPVLLDAPVLAELGELAGLAPLHNPPALDAIAALNRLAPTLAGVACFDTGFHRTMPAAATAYAIPRQWAEWGVRRYGFHGLSHAYGSRRVAELLGRPAASLRTVTCHLGAGASLCAVHGGASVDTTMGYTPLEGLVMATRSGSVDPGAVLALQQYHGLTAADAERALTHQAGLLGLAGTADMRQVVRRADDGDGDARLALDVYVHRLRSSIAAMAAAMGGVDALTFSGGVGENAPSVRAAAAAGLAFLGVAIDDAANRNMAGGDREISPPGAVVRTFVIRAREDVEIADACRRVISRRRPDS
jgi:acetate kinase